MQLGTSCFQNEGTSSLQNNEFLDMIWWSISVRGLSGGGGIIDFIGRSRSRNAKKLPLKLIVYRRKTRLIAYLQSRFSDSGYVLPRNKFRL